MVDTGGEGGCERRVYQKAFIINANKMKGAGRVAATTMRDRGDAGRVERRKRGVRVILFAERARMERAEKEHQSTCDGRIGAA